jgi:transposase-like protein
VDFQERFPDEAACLEYLAESRWPEGYRCRACGGKHAWVLERRHPWECASCHHQTSVTAGTVMHRTRTPLRLWFWAAYLLATHTPGISAKQLQRQLGLSRYETAWLILQKLRRAMVAPERESLRGEVEVAENVEARAIVHTDGWRGYTGLRDLGFDHRPISQRWRSEERRLVLPRAHRALSNVKTWLQGTHRSASEKHLQVYLDEFVFRHNRRRTPMAAFQTLLGLGAAHEPSTYAEITSRAAA